MEQNTAAFEIQKLQDKHARKVAKLEKKHRKALAKAEKNSRKMMAAVEKKYRKREKRRELADAALARVNSSARSAQLSGAASN